MARSQRAFSPPLSTISSMGNGPVQRPVTKLAIEGRCRAEGDGASLRMYFKVGQLMGFVASRAEDLRVDIYSHRGSCARPGHPIVSRRECSDYYQQGSSSRSQFGAICLFDHQCPSTSSNGASFESPAALGQVVLSHCRGSSSSPISRRIQLIQEERFTTIGGQPHWRDQRQQISRLLYTPKGVSFAVGRPRQYWLYERAWKPI